MHIVRGNTVGGSSVRHSAQMVWRCAHRVLIKSQYAHHYIHIPLSSPSACVDLSVNAIAWIATGREVTLDSQ